MTIISVGREGQEIGDFDLAGIEEGLASGYFLSTDLGWYDGLTEWLPLADVVESLTCTPETLPPAFPPVSPDATSAYPLKGMATQRQIDYIKDLAGKVPKGLTKKGASELIERLLADPATEERRQKRREREEREMEKHQSYFLRKEVEQARAMLEEATSEGEIQGANEALQDAAINRLQFWQLTFSMDAFENEEATKLFEKQGDKFRKPTDAQIQQVLDDLDSKAPKWEMKEALSFYARLAELYPSLRMR